ncbi:MAG: hypothetical protein U1E45_18345 [Geminicoccaceae bacterium]
MRVLLLEQDPIEAIAVQRELAGRFDVRTVGSVADMQALVIQAGWQPDVIVTCLELPDASGPKLVHALALVAGAVPVLVRTGPAGETLSRQLQALSAGRPDDQSSGPEPLERLLWQQHLLQPSLTAHKAEILGEFERVARTAADMAVGKAIDGLLARLGLDDEEGMRMAIRLARGWEAAKSRFFSTLATGIASAMLLALGAGIVAMLRSSANK